MNAALIHQKKGNHEEAIKLANEVLKDDANNVKAYYRRACSHSANGDIELAKQDALKALELDP